MTTDFEDSEGLRAVLDRLTQAGADAWREDEEAAALMSFTMRKYGALARKHHLAPEDAAVAAFEVMRTRSARTAFDPWALVTRAVQVTLIADERANGLLCSTTRARRLTNTGEHDAERFSERETPLYEYHPAFHVAPEQGGIDPDTAIRDECAGEDEVTSSFVAVDVVVELFVALGWPLDTARAALDYVAARLIQAGSRPNAHEVLRRDHYARALLDLDRRTWAALLRVVLGSPNPDLAHTTAGRGVLLRVLIGEEPDELLADDSLVASIHACALRATGRTHA